MKAGVASVAVPEEAAATVTGPCSIFTKAAKASESTETARSAAGKAAETGLLCLMHALCILLGIHARGKGLVAEFIVDLPLFRVSQDGIRLGDILELLLRLRIARIGIRVILLGQLPVGFFDLVCIRIPGHTQDRVEILSTTCGISAVSGICSSVSVLSISCHHTPPVPAAYAFRGTGKLIVIILLYLLYNTLDGTGQAGRGYFLLPFSFSFFCGRIGMIIFLHNPNSMQPPSCFGKDWIC